MNAGKVVLVGAGPGAPDLITLRGQRALEQAEVVLFDELAPPRLLTMAPSHAERINVGKRGHELPTRSQDEINALMIRLARKGKRVVRLKGGDPYVFGRGGEEASACRAAGVPFEVVPGISSATGMLAYAGIPLTDRRHAASFAVVTGHKDPSAAREQIRWGHLARGADTLVVLMGMQKLPEIVEKLLDAGRAPETPAAAIMSGSTPGQRVVVSSLAGLVAAVGEAALHAPAALVVGDVVRLRSELSWFEQLPLFGRRILVTRQPEQAGAWCRALEASGAAPIEIPMIQIAPVRGSDEIREALAQLPVYDWLLLTSANAARALADRAAEAGLSLDAVRARVLTVGEATERAARACGLPNERVETAGPHAAAMLETLAARAHVAGSRVLLPRAERGRELLGRGLRERGAQVDEIVVYRTEPAGFDAAALCAEIAAGGLDAITFASPSAVRNFAGGVGPREAFPAQAVPIVAAIGPVTAEACREAGWPTDIVAARPDADALVGALEAHFSGIGGEEEPR